MLLNDVRRVFLGFFEKNGHKHLPSGPLVPHDPTLLFSNAGMVQFKDVFLGLDRRDYNSATTSQKCLRISGKHNDLEQVGFTKRHHTFFEMLGNFSFGRYFKEGAIPFAWEVLTKELRLNPDKLYITTYFDDDEAANIWRKVSGKETIRISTSDNFWSMGDTGPCGPCSEIYYDHGDKYYGDLPSDTADTGDRYVEIWNLVFMQYNQTKDGRLPLAKPCIDTGMGLERIAAVMQGVCDNFDTNTFKRLIQNAADIIKNSDIKSPSYRIIADHLRASSFLIAEGILPGNEGRNYVLRRIIRRAVRHIDRLCKSDEPIFFKLLNCLIAEMGDYYNEIVEKKDVISDVLRLEECKFRETLKMGLGLLEKDLADTDLVSGETAFKLYDTYGFPVDITESIAQESGKNVDISGFEDLLAKQRLSSRAAWKGSGDIQDSGIFYNLKSEVNPTEFVGYGLDEIKEARVVGIISGSALLGSCSAGENVAIVLDKTPFYAESGGQVGDTGKIKAPGFFFDVTDTKKALGQFFIHYGTVSEGQCRVGDLVSANINWARRESIRANHTAVHLLHKVLRQKFGNQLFQKGSYVSDEKFHLDFNHQHQISVEDIEDIEERVNSVIRAALPVKIDVMAKQEAIRKGAIALFEEKYGESVRMVSVGDFSIELCGGTHVSDTSKIMLFKIVSESGIASGVRRIEGVTGVGAVRYLNNASKEVRGIASILKVPESGALDAVRAMSLNIKNLEKALLSVKVKLAMLSVDEMQLEGFRIYYALVDDLDSKSARQIIDFFRAKHKSGVFLVIVNDSAKSKSTALISVSDDLTDRYDARRFAENVVRLLSGKGGGGKVNFAQCGGEICKNIEEILNAFK